MPLSATVSTAALNPAIAAFPPAKKKASGFSIFCEEARAHLIHLFPFAGKWLWEKYVVGSITTLTLQATADKVAKTAFFNLHQPASKQPQAMRPVIFLHGDYGHPFYLLHLIETAKKSGHPVYSLYLPKAENNTYFEEHSQLLKKALEKIQALTGQKEILGIGHSKGAILLAHRQFVAMDSTLKATCSIAGRLNIPEGESVPEPTLERIVKKIHEAIVQNPSLPLMQIVPADDWNASREAMAVRPNERCQIVPGMHFSGVYSPETATAVNNFLTEL
jgi:hypothetical protein